VYTTNRKEMKEAPTPTMETIFFGIFLKPSPLIRKPMSGTSGISAIKDID
jgi:hypothetical protein